MNEEYDKLIAHQAFMLSRQRSKIKRYEEIFKDIYDELFCIGAPLNDNKHHYSPDQLKIFYRIFGMLPTYCEEEED